MSSFTDYYFEYGYNSALEKIAKAKDDEGMSLGAKAGIGAGAAGAAGAAGYYGGEGLKAMGYKKQGKKWIKGRDKAIKSVSKRKDAAAKYLKKLFK